MYNYNYKSNTSSISYENKYIKYKNKYLNLKDKINEMKGGNLLNLKNILVMGAGPIALVNTLALIKRYPFNIASEIERDDFKGIDGNNIFLVGKELPWRPQIFFFQNSYREYDSADFIRDIDLETYKLLEKVGCYIGAPTSTLTPFCFTSTDNEGNYEPSALGSNSKIIRAPSRMSPEHNNTVYIMNHLSFQTSDLEVILLDRIISINKENLKFYLNKASNELTLDIIKFLNLIKEGNLNKIYPNSNALNCEMDLLTGLIIKDELLSKNMISIKDFRPLVIIFHPFNGYCNYNSFILYKLYKLYKTNNNKSFDPYFSLLRNEYITQNDIDETGNFIPKIWEPTKDSNGDIYLKLLKNCGIEKYNIPSDKLDFLTKNKICNKNGEIIFIQVDEYDIVFDAEGANKQFGTKNDYYAIRNRDKINLDDKKNHITLPLNAFLPNILGQNNIIKLSNYKESDFYLIIKDNRENSNVITKESIDYIQNKLYLKKLTKKATSTTSYLDDFEPVGPECELIIEFKKSELEPILLQINSLYSISNYTYGGEDGSNENEEKRLMFKLSKIPLKNLVIGNIAYTKIEKVNTLYFEESKFDLDNYNPSKDSIVYASVWLFEANKDNNIMKYKEYITIENSDGTNVENVPLCSGPICLNKKNDSTNFDDTIKIRKRIDYKTLPNQVYINNDQVQYFNNSVENTFKSGKLLHQDFNLNQNLPQHSFRVFGVNLNKHSKYNDIKNPKLNEIFKNTSEIHKYYYNGVQISKEINDLYKEIKEDKKNLILKMIFIMAMLYSQDIILENIFTDDNKFDVNTFNKILYDKINLEWNKSYAKKMPSTYSEIKNIPIHEKLKTIFPITLRYKINTIEKNMGKTIFNLGDSNTTVNFFSGTGLNTGVSNIKKILSDYKTNLDNNKIKELNKNYMHKNRRTIYNSLLSSQNPSILSPIRMYESNKIGPFKTYISKGTLEEVNQNINHILNQKPAEVKELNDLIDINVYEFSEDKHLRAANLFLLLKNFESFFKYFVTQEIPGTTNEDINNPMLKFIEIHKVIKWNLFVCIYNLYLENPVLGTKDFNKESINYLNHIVFNYFDFCNFMYGDNIENNKQYNCDVTGKDPYDSKRSEGFIYSKNFTT